MKKIFYLLLLCLGVITTAVAQEFCELRIAGPKYYSSSDLVPFEDNIYHFFSYSENGIEHPCVFLVKSDHCLRVIDSVKAPLDSGLYRTVPFPKKIGSKIYVLAYIRDIPYFDTIPSHYKNEFLVYDTTLTLARRADISSALGEYNFRPDFHSLGDSLILVTSSNRRGVIGTAFTLFDLQANKIDQFIEDNLFIYSNPVGSFSGRSDYFISAGRFNFFLDISPFQLTSIDTFITPAQHATQELLDVVNILNHPGGDTYVVGLSRATKFGYNQAVIIYRLNPQGQQVGDLVYGHSNGNDVVANKVAVIAANGDLVIASYRSRPTQTGVISDLVVTRVDEDLNIKWQKILSLPNTSFISIASAATPDNGATFVSVTSDSTELDPSLFYNDLHYLHIDSTGYYSPLSTSDFKNMLQSAATVYPNPVNTSFTIEGLDDTEVYEAGIYDVNGTLLQRSALGFPFEVNVADLAPGSYLMILQDKNGARINRKFVKY